MPSRGSHLRIFRITQWLQQAFDYGTPDAKKQAVAYLLAMRPRDASQEPPDLLVSNYSIHGALLLQTVVNFPADSNRIVIQSFMDLTSPVLRHLSLHPVGCRVVEAYIVSQQVGLKAKKRLLKSLAGNYADLAMDKYGSHIVDKLWSQVADMDDKEQIAEELLKSLSALQNSHHGKFVVRNCRLENYKREREQWRKKEAGADRRKEMFKEFLEPEGTNREEQAVAIDPLLQSKAFDETMKSLGFSEKHEPSAHAKGADKSKKQRNSQKHGKDKKAKRTADKSAEALDLDLPDVSLPAKAPETGRANATTAKDTGLELVLDAVRSSGKKRKGSGGDKGGRNDKKRKFMS